MNKPLVKDSSLTAASLVEHLRHESEVVKEHAAHTLQVLSAVPHKKGGDAKRMAIFEAGAIPPLVELLRSGSSNARQIAAGTLCNLAGTDEIRIAIADAGGID